MIELGETEVNCAQEYVRCSNEKRWRLLIVEDALSTQPRVLMLPNPFARSSRTKFCFAGNSVRLRFELKAWFRPPRPIPARPRTCRETRHVAAVAETEPDR